MNDDQFHEFIDAINEIIHTIQDGFYRISEEIMNLSVRGIEKKLDKLMDVMHDCCDR